MNQVFSESKEVKELKKYELKILNNLLWGKIFPSRTQNLTPSTICKVDYTKIKKVVDGKKYFKY